MPPSSRSTDSDVIIIDRKTILSLVIDSFVGGSLGIDGVPQPSSGQMTFGLLPICSKHSTSGFCKHISQKVVKVVG
jgi:hypothetical protein